MSDFAAPVRFCRRVRFRHTSLQGYAPGRSRFIRIAVIHLGGLHCRDVLVVHGGAPLRGEVRVRGAKNLVSKAMVATVLGDDAEPHVRRARASATSRSCAACWSCTACKVSDGAADGELVFDPSNVERAGVDEINVHAGSSRIPILLCGPLLHRLGHAFIPDLGGCNIGGRPIDFHLAGAAPSSARSSTRRPRACTSPRPNGLHGIKFELRLPVGRRHRADPAHRGAAPRASPSCATRPSSRRSST